ncbi:MAG: hypothetical protein JNL32_03550 [Candidatus Kapabacteria bacterium]|nr:hypothetical protein [Candidatus Kapabacteria bacterium]
MKQILISTLCASLLLVIISCSNQKTTPTEPKTQVAMIDTIEDVQDIAYCSNFTFAIRFADIRTQAEYLAVQDSTRRLLETCKGYVFPSVDFSTRSVIGFRFISLDNYTHTLLVVRNDSLRELQCRVQTTRISDDFSNDYHPYFFVSIPRFDSTYKVVVKHDTLTPKD